MKDFISIGQVCIILGLSLSTIYRRLKSGILQEDFRTHGGHRRFDVERIKKLVRVKRTDVIVTYSRANASCLKIYSKLFF